MTSYWQRSRADLARLAENRGLAVHSTAKNRPARTRQDYARALQSADNDPASLLGLPPEMRLRIYEELLPIEPGSLTCHPAILSVCKQINSEATSILYDRRIYDVKIRPLHVEVHGTPLLDFRPSYQPSRRQITRLQWPVLLRNVHNIRLTSALPPTPGTNQQQILLNHVVYSLCAHLVENNKLSSLELDLRTACLHLGEDALLHAVTYPLEMLAGAGLEIRIRVRDDRTIRAPMSSAGSSPNQGSNVLTAAIAIGQEASAYESVYERLTTPARRRAAISYHNGRAADSTASSYDEIKRELDRELRAQRLFDEVWEEGVRHRTEKLRQALGQLHIDDKIAHYAAKIDRMVDSLQKLKAVRLENDADAADAKAREGAQAEREKEREEWRAAERATHAESVRRSQAEFEARMADEAGRWSRYLGK